MKKLLLPSTVPDVPSETAMES